MNFHLLFEICAQASVTRGAVTYEDNLLSKNDSKEGQCALHQNIWNQFHISTEYYIPNRLRLGIPNLTHIFNLTQFVQNQA